MKKIAKLLIFVGMVALVAGFFTFVVGDYNITTSGKTISDVFEGEISVLGNDNDITIKAGSDVDMVTLLGKGNTIRVEPGAVVQEIRGGGAGNSIVKPEGMEILTELLQDLSEEAAPLKTPERPLDGL